jgi:hypothetical protein
VLHRGAIERAEQRPALHPRAPALRIHPDGAHRGQVDHQAAVRDAQSEHAVPAAAHADLELALAAVADGVGHVVRGRAANDRPRAAIDHGVPHRPGGVVSVGAVFEEPALGRSTHHGAGFSGPPRDGSTGAPPGRRYGFPYRAAIAV